MEFKIGGLVKVNQDIVTRIEWYKKLVDTNPTGVIVDIRNGIFGIDNGIKVKFKECEFIPVPDEPVTMPEKEVEVAKLYRELV